MNKIYKKNCWKCYAIFKFFFQFFKILLITSSNLSRGRFFGAELGLSKKSSLFRTIFFFNNFYVLYFCKIFTIFSEFKSLQITYIFFQILYFLEIFTEYIVYPKIKYLQNVFKFTKRLLILKKFFLIFSSPNIFLSFTVEFSRHFLQNVFKISLKFSENYFQIC